MFFTCTASADEKTTKAISFSIKPGLCVLDEGETECRDTLHVKWKSSAYYSLCLYQKNVKQSLYCWTTAREGEHRFAVVTSKTIEFELRKLDDHQILITKNFTLLTRESRNRRRNPWSFF